MRLRSFRAFLSAMVPFAMIMLSMELSACTNTPTPPVAVSPASMTPAPEAVITWPFHPNNKEQWVIINGYRGNADHHVPGGSPNDYAHLAFDFARCFPNQVRAGQGVCSFPAGWDTASTDGQVVYSPVTGHIRWIDQGKITPPPSLCRSLGIALDSTPGYYIALAHVKELYQNGDPNKPFQVGDSVTQGQPIGKISEVSGGGCFGDAHHVHMALYYLCSGCNVDLQRQAVAFSGQWSIATCQYPDDDKTSNQYQSVLVPCNSNAIASSTPTTSTPRSRQLSSVQTASQTVNATGQGTKPATSASGMLMVTNADPHNTITFSAGQIFSNAFPTPIQMVLDANVSVPPPSPGQYYSSAMVPAHVIPVGTIGNIPPEDADTELGFRYNTTDSNGFSIQVLNSTPFTGGQDPQTYTVVKQSDIDGAANVLEASTKQSAIAGFNSQLQSNERLIGNPQCTYSVSSDHVAGDRANTVTVTVKTTCTATAST